MFVMIITNIATMFEYFIASLNRSTPKMLLYINSEYLNVERKDMFASLNAFRKHIKNKILPEPRPANSNVSVIVGIVKDSRHGMLIIANA